MVTSRTKEDSVEDLVRDKPHGLERMIFFSDAVIAITRFSSRSA